jgi:hypothetical protein
MMIKGIRVVDSGRPLVLYVHEKDVAKGKAKDCENCAIAVALKRQLKVRHVRVYLTKTYVLIRGRWVRYHTPRDCRNQLKRFDRGIGFEEAVYKLAPPSPTERINGRAHHGNSPRSLAMLNNKNAKGAKKRTTGVRASAYQDLYRDMIEQRA